MSDPARAQLLAPDDPPHLLHHSMDGSSGSAAAAAAAAAGKLPSSSSSSAVPRSDDAASSLSCTDFIMEDSQLVLAEVARYLQEHQDPAGMTQQLVAGYEGTAQHCNILANWLVTFAEEAPEDVKAVIEGNLADRVAAAFDPAAVDESIIGTDDPEAFMSWLTQLVQFREWRDLIYQLSQGHPSCVFLTMAIKEISERGFEDEIKYVPAACSQLTVFCRYLKASLSKLLAEEFDLDYERDLEQFLEMACYGEATYLFTQVLLFNLALKPRDGKAHVVKRISQELERAAQQQKRDVSKYSVQLCGANSYPKAVTSLQSMLSRRQLNTADMLALHEQYQQQDQPPVSLLRLPLFVQLVTDALFIADSQLEPDFEAACAHLLACAAAHREHAGQSEMSLTHSAIVRASEICRRNSKHMMKSVLELLKCLRYPAVAYGVLTFVEHLLTDPRSGIDLNQVDQATVYLVLIDEAATSHAHLRHRITGMLCRLFEHNYQGLEELSQIEFKMRLIDRFIHLMFVGHVQPVLMYMNTCLANKRADMSVLRYFVLEVLDMIGPPYTPAFANAFRLLVQNDDIYKAIDKREDRESCDLFLRECRSMTSSSSSGGGGGSSG